MLVLYIIFIILIIILIYLLYKIRFSKKESFTDTTNTRLFNANKKLLTHTHITPINTNTKHHLNYYIDEIIKQSNILETHLLHINICNNCITKYFLNISVLHSEILSLETNNILIKESATVYSNAFDQFLNSNYNKQIISDIVTEIHNIKIKLIKNKNINKHKYKASTKIIKNDRVKIYKASEFHKDILPLPNYWYI